MKKFKKHIDAFLITLFLSSISFTFSYLSGFVFAPFIYKHQSSLAFELSCFFIFMSAFLFIAGVQVIRIYIQFLRKKLNES